MSNHDSITYPGSSKNLADTVASSSSFHTLNKAFKAAELTNILKSTGPSTVFAPTDDAFAKLPNGTLENWLKPENKAELISVLNFHVLPGRTSAGNVEKLTDPKMMQVKPRTSPTTAITSASPKRTSLSEISHRAMALSMRSTRSLCLPSIDSPE